MSTLLLCAHVRVYVCMSPSVGVGWGGGGGLDAGRAHRSAREGGQPTALAPAAHWV